MEERPVTCTELAGAAGISRLGQVRVDRDEGGGNLARVRELGFWSGSKTDVRNAPKSVAKQAKTAGFAGKGQVAEPERGDEMGIRHVGVVGIDGHGALEVDGLALGRKLIGEDGRERARVAQLPWGRGLKIQPRRLRPEQGAGKHGRSDG